MIGSWTDKWGDRWVPVDDQPDRCYYRWQRVMDGALLQVDGYAVDLDYRRGVGSPLLATADDPARWLTEEMGAPALDLGTPEHRSAVMRRRRLVGIFEAEYLQAKRAADPDPFDLFMIRSHVPASAYDEMSVPSTPGDPS